MRFKEVVIVFQISDSFRECGSLAREDGSQGIGNDVEETGNEQYDRNDHQNIVHIADSGLFMVSDMRSG